MSNAEDLFSPDDRREKHRGYTHGEPAEHCDRKGALALKEKIEAYWRARGYVVSVRIDRQEFTSIMRTARYDLRSDMVGGLPRFRVLSPEQEQ